MSKHKKVLPYVPVMIEKVAGKNILTVGYQNSLNNIKIELDDKTAEKIPDYADLEIYLGWDD